MIKLSSICKEFPDKKILDNAELFISPTDKVGLIGVNGSGKSTLMRILIGKEEFDTGNLYIAPDTRVTYLSQELPEFKKRTLIEEAKYTFPQLIELQNELNHLEEKMQTENDNLKIENIVIKYSHIQDELNRLNAQKLEADIYKVLKGLGFSEDDFEKPIGTFSGGWQMRIALGKLLLEKPDLLLLDEPTNHLDIDAIEWLEDYLVDYEGAIIVISHDKRFLNKVVKRIVELEHAKLSDYPGNYSTFEELKEKNLETLLSSKERQEKEMKRMQTFVDRFRASANRSTQAKSREKMLAKIELIDVPKSTDTIHFKFPSPQPSGRLVLKLKNIQKSFDGFELFNVKSEIWIERGNKIAIVGGNGVGKTTLMKIITEEEALSSGSLEYGHNVISEYFAQNQSEKLNIDNTAIEEIYELVPEYTLTQVRSLLGRFLFTNEKAFQEISSLSGGEKSRLAMAKMLLTPANFILMDEPTNHLDIPSKNVLIKALSEFPETFIVISHDRDFIASTCNRIFEINNKEIKIYEGNYDYYLERRALNNQISSNKLEDNEENIKVQVSKDYREDKKEKQKKLAFIEKNIIKLEEKIKKIEIELSGTEIYNDSEKLVKINTEYNKLKSELEGNYTDWELLVSNE